MSVNQLAAEEEALLEAYTEVRHELVQNQAKHTRTARNGTTFVTKLPSSFYVFFPLLVSLSIGFAMPLVAGFDFVYVLVCFQTHIPQDQCMASPVSSGIVTNFTSLTTFLDGISGLLLNPILSSLSDHIGRRKLFLYCLGMLTLSTASRWWLVAGFETPPSYWWLLVPHILSDLAGGIGLLMSLSVSYVSDLIDDPQDRASAISLVDASMSLAMAISPTFGSWILRNYGLGSLFRFGFLIISVATVVAYFALQESLSRHHMERNKNLKNTWTEMFDLLWFRKLPDPISRRNARIFLICSVAGMEFVLANIMTLIIYLKTALGWTAVETGYMMGAGSMTRSILLLAAFPWVYNKLSKKWTVYAHEPDIIDVILLRNTLLMFVLGFLGYTISSTPAQFTVSAIVEAFAAVGMPSMKSTLIKTVPKGEFGSFMACYGFLASAIEVVLPPLMLQIYNWSFHFFPSLPFLITTIILTILLGSTLLIQPRA